MPDYKPQALDRKWQERWTSARAFEVTEDPSRPKYLLPRDVCVSVGARACRARPQLHHRRRHGAHQAAARLQRAASVRLGCLRPAGRKRGHQERHPSRNLDAGQHRAHERPAPAPGHQLRLGARVCHVRADLLQVEPVAVHQDVRARAGVSPALVGELVREGSDRAGQRAGRRRRLLALRHARDHARSGAMVFQDHALRRRPAERASSTSASGRKKC